MRNNFVWRRLVTKNIFCMEETRSEELFLYGGDS